MTRLLVAIAILAVVAWYVRRYTAGTMASSGLKVTSRAVINRGATVAVVEVDEQRFLVGASAESIRCLAELSPATPTDEPPAEPDRPDIPAGPLSAEQINAMLDADRPAGLRGALQRMTTRYST